MFANHFEKGDEGLRNLAKANGKHRPISVLSIPELRARPRPTWLLRGLLLRTGLAVVYGSSGAGKTFAVLDMACAVGRGIPWFGRRVKRGHVVYVAAEGALWLRLDAYIKHHRITDNELDGLAVVEQPVNLLDPGGDLENLIQAIHEAIAQRSWDSVDLIVVDTLNRAMPGGNENASEDMGRMVEAAKTIERAFACAVLYVHHAGKNEAMGSRGHSSLKAAADAEISVKGAGDGPRIICAEKVREGESGEDVGAFNLVQVDLGATIDHDPDAESNERDWSCVVTPCEMPKAKGSRLKDAERLALNYLHRTLDTQAAIPPADVHKNAGKNCPKAGQTACRVDDWRDYAVKAGGLSSSDKAATHRTAFHRCRLALEKAGFIGVFDEWAWLRDKRDKDATT